MAAEGDNIVRFTYTGADVEVIPEEATHIFVKARVVRAQAFLRHPNIVEVICHDSVKKIEQEAFEGCRLLRRVVMRGVKIVEESAFHSCVALEDVECGKLEIIGRNAFHLCTSLRSINLPSARIVRSVAFSVSWGLAVVKFGSKLERVEERAFYDCHRLEQITIPLKDGLFSDDGIFTGCNLNRVDLVEGELHETIAALHLEGWRNDMNQEIDSINQILPNAFAGGWDDDIEWEEESEKAQAIRWWIRSVLHKIIRYQEGHLRLLNEAAATLEPVLPNNDIVRNNVLPFLKLPSHTFEVGDEEDEYYDSDEDIQLVELLSLSRIDDSDEEEEQVSHPDSWPGDEEDE
jgi:hypothetical protein